MGVTFVAGFGALILGILYTASRAQKRRTEAVSAVAQQVGWAFQAQPPLDVVPGFGRFEIFSTGRWQQVRNHLAGEAGGRSVSVFDFSYVTGAGKSRRRWMQTVVHVRLPGADLPAFTLRPEHVFHRVGSLFGYQDIDIPGDPAFSRKHLLRGADLAGIYALFGPGLREFFNRNPGNGAEAAGEDLFFWRPMNVVRPAEIGLLVEQALTLADRLQAASAGSQPVEG